MKEIDSETTVVWPAWCYSGNTPTDILQQKPAKATTATPAKHQSEEQAQQFNSLPAAAATKRKHLERLASDLRQQQQLLSGSNSSTANMLSERSLLLSGYGAIDSSKQLREASSPTTGATAAAATATTGNSNAAATPATAANTSATATATATAAAAAAAVATAAAATTAATNAAAAAYAALYFDRVKHEKLSPLHMTSAQIDSLKDVFLESTVMVNIHNNNNNNNNNSSSSNNNNNNNSSSSNNNISNTNSNSNHQQQLLSINSSNVKRERLSPSSNNSSTNNNNNNGELSVSAAFASWAWI
ncbi:hypothetical protein AWZ03_006897 [Drosophila navojoa]|uniref:Uncharacterized protein n=1 Tax=Drosophila navojoa TaxID=7232 RepID=A0A484BCZ6_DRONA|nr:hypothetical protein AWZ03_006897 [Drosophila navojoa]